ncbi:MAG: pyrroline-5-carboxylate reductase [Pseudomonadota bacterium]|nr:pyrroline-5-carboxylate reductase [Pseudomonadota bacterium]
MNHPTIAFIGGGNMARSLIGGTIARGASPGSIRVAEPVEELREALHREYGVETFATAAEAVDGASVWLFAVKPQVIRVVCTELAASARAAGDKALAISIAAGITSAQLSGWLQDATPVVRAMPNTPSLLGAGITGLFATPAASAAQREQAETVLSAVGPVVWVDDEAQMDAVTAVSGSGPAYVFLLAEAMQAAGVAEGLPEQAARMLAAHTLLGASRMLVESGEAADVLRKRVTSPGGTTQAAIETFQSGGFAELVGRAVAAAAARGRELAAANA